MWSRSWKKKEETLLRGKLAKKRSEENWSVHEAFSGASPRAPLPLGPRNTEAVRPSSAAAASTAGVTLQSDINHLLAPPYSAENLTRFSAIFLVSEEKGTERWNTTGVSGRVTEEINGTTTTAWTPGERTTSEKKGLILNDGGVITKIAMKFILFKKILGSYGIDIYFYFAERENEFQEQRTTCLIVAMNW